MRYKLNSNLIVPTASVCLGGLFAGIGISSWGLWDPLTGPTRGMYPSLIAAALVLVGIIDFVKAFKGSAPVFERKNWLIVLAVLVVILCSYVIGLLASVGIFLLLWLKIAAKQSWKTTLIVMLVMGAIVYGVFIWWLQVSFEEGLLFNWIRG